MNKEQIYDIFYEQMAKDYACSDKEIRDYQNYIKKDMHRDGRRLYKSEGYMAKCISLSGKFVLCVDEDTAVRVSGGAGERYEELMRRFDALSDIPGEWLSLGQYTGRINDIAAEFGYSVMDQHHYYLPLGVNAISDDEIAQMKKRYRLTLYEKDELEQFKEDKRFTSALTYVRSAPDMIALTAELDGQILGMSGASADSDSMWQIGINVMKEARGLGIGPFLTVLMKEEILRRGKLPFYGTAESHIQSQRVGIKAGFVPTWWEGYVYKNKESGL